MSYFPIKGTLTQSQTFTLASDVSTADTSNPPTVVLHSDTFTKLTSTSFLEITTYIGTSNSGAGGLGRFMPYVDSTDGDDVASLVSHAASMAVAVTGFGRFTGDAAGARTVGVKYGASAGTQSVNVTGIPVKFCRIVVKEIEPT